MDLRVHRASWVGFDAISFETLDKAYGSNVLNVEVLPSRRSQLSMCAFCLHVHKEKKQRKKNKFKKCVIQ